MTAILHTDGLGKRYRRRWALRDCTLSLPPGRVAGPARRPAFCVRDEPVASLDPLARRQFLQHLMEAVAEHGLSVLLSSHLVADLERVCDHLIVLAEARVLVAGDVDALFASHH